MKRRYRFQAQQMSAHEWCPLKFKTKGNPVGHPGFAALLSDMYETGGIWQFKHDWRGMLLDAEALEVFLASTGLRLYLEEETGFDEGFLWREGA